MRLDPKLVLALSTAVLSACARDLDVPSPSAAPRVTRFSPAAAYAGEQLVITGAGFDSDPLGNLVQFGRASARADAASEGSIVVRVPADAGDGPFTVTTKGGVSAPSAAFTYLGRGQLSAHSVVNALPMLHKPYRVLPARDETFLHSDLLLGIVRYGDPSFVASTGVYLDQARWTLPDPSVVWLESDGAAGTSRLVRATVGPGGAVTTGAAVGIPYSGVGPMVVLQAGGGRPDAVAVFGAGPTVALRRLDTLAPLQAAATVLDDATNLPVAEVRNCVDAGGGELACLGRAGSGDPLTIFRLRLTAAPSATATFPAPAPPAALVENRFLPEDPLCADPATHRVVAALSDGRLASIDATGLTSFTTVSTGSRTPARSLTCVPGATAYGTATGPTVLVSKAADGLLTRMDPVTGALRWTAAVPLASFAGLWCADASCTAGSGATVHAAGEADNTVVLLGLDGGDLLARRTLDVGAGRVHAPSALLDRTGNQGAAWYQASGAGAPPTLAFLTTAPPGVIEWPLTAQRGSGLYPHFRDRPDAVAVVPWWSGRDYETVRSRRFVTGSTSWGFDPALSGTAQLAADGSDHLHLGTSWGLESVRWDTGVVADAWFGPAEFMSLQRLPNGDVVAGVRDGNQNWFAVGWTAANPDAMPPGWQWPPVGSPTSPWMVLGAVRLEGALQVFYWDDPGSGLPLELHAVTLTDAGAEVPGSDQLVDDAFYSVLAVSPNGRTFVSWDFQSYSRDTSVVIWSGDAGAGFPRLATIPLDGQVAGAAFDATGETLYVVTRGPDRIVVVQ